jgi:putative DNA primase/helicase
MPLIARDGEHSNGTASPKGPKPASSADIQRWATVLFGGAREGVVGLSAVGVTRHSTDATHAENTLYAHDEKGLARLARDAREITPRAEAVYYSLNPVMTSASTSWRNEDIYRRRWILVDFDPVRPAKTSATDDEKQQAKVTAVAARKWLREENGWPTPIVADSGNGYHLLFRAELPNDAAAAELVKQVLRAVHARWSDDAVHVDTSVHDARRVVKCYGTLARKGESTAERPHRASAMLEVPDDLVVVPREKLEAVAALAPVEHKGGPEVTATNGTKASGNDPGPAAPTSKPKRRGLIARALDPDSREFRLERAELYVDAMPPAVSGQGGHSQTFDAACALIKGFGLTVDEARPILDRYNARCQPPWSERELEHKLASADAKADDKPRGYLWEADRDGYASGNGKASANGKPKKGPVTVESPEGITEHADDPYRLARGYLQGRHAHDDRSTLLWWNEEWWTWSRTGNHWRPTGQNELVASVAGWVKAEFDRIARQVGGLPKPITTRLLSNVMLALRAQATVPMDHIPELPAWLDPQAKDPDPRTCIVTRSGIVVLPRLAVGSPDSVLTPTPRYFTPNALSYAFDTEPEVPVTWLGFLQDLWGDDPESIAALQEWFGYLLTSDTSRQKILMILGPRRSGKGTINRTLRALVGEANVAAPTLSSMAGPFGLQPLIGKTVCLCPESRLTGRSDTQAIVERLLSVSGEDPQTLDRKRIESWHGVLRTRFVLMGNEFPRLSDYSDAILGRLVLLKLTKSFYGREDSTLSDRIAGELPGILLWAIAGWHRLQGQPKFTQPASGLEDLEEAQELVNPVGAFVAQRCVVGGDETAPVSEVYEAWRKWCEANGREHPGDVAGFSRNLRTAVPKIAVRRPKVGDQRIRFLVGLGLKPEEGGAF